MKLLGIKNEAPSRPPITYRTLQQDIINMCEKYDTESDETEEEDEDEEEDEEGDIPLVGRISPDIVE